MFIMCQMSISKKQLLFLPYRWASHLFLTWMKKDGTSLFGHSQQFAFHSPNTKERLREEQYVVHGKYSGTRSCLFFLLFSLILGLMVVSYYAVIDFFSRGFGYIGRFADSVTPSREVGGMVFEERKELFFRFNAILCQSINLVSSLPYFILTHSSWLISSYGRRDLLILFLYEST